MRYQETKINNNPFRSGGSSKKTAQEPPHNNLQKKRWGYEMGKPFHLNPKYIVLGVGIPLEFLQWFHSDKWGLKPRSRRYIAAQLNSGTMRHSQCGALLQPEQTPRWNRAQRNGISRISPRPAPWATLRRWRKKMSNGLPQPVQGQWDGCG